MAHMVNPVVYVECPETGCAKVLPVEIVVALSWTGPSMQDLVCTPDLVEVWNHYFFHHPKPVDL